MCISFGNAKRRPARIHVHNIYTHVYVYNRIFQNARVYDRCGDEVPSISSARGNRIRYLRLGLHIIIHRFTYIIIVTTQRVYRRAMGLRIFKRKVVSPRTCARYGCLNHHLTSGTVRRALSTGVVKRFNNR